MTKLTLEQRRLNTLRRTEIRIEESANALIGILQQWNAKPGGRTVKREAITHAIPDYIEEVVRIKSGIRTIPTVNNLAVRLPTEAFINKNWKAIRETACSFGYFIIWNPPGEALGLRLGTLEEYTEQQEGIQQLLIAMMDFHNARAITIVRHDGDATAVEIIIEDVDD